MRSKVPAAEVALGARQSAGQPALLALTTEHFNLQTARSATISESVGRSMIFLGAVSSALVALALVGQIGRFGEAFLAFALIVLPTLLVLGVLTYLRLVETSIEDVLLGRAINRIRGYYLGLDETAAPYFLQTDRDDLHGVLANSGRRNTRWHLLSHAATMVLIVTSVVAGGFLALGLVTVWPGGPVAIYAIAGASLAIATAGLLAAHQARRWREVNVASSNGEATGTDGSLAAEKRSLVRLITVKCRPRKEASKVSVSETGG